MVGGFLAGEGELKFSFGHIKYEIYQPPNRQMCVSVVKKKGLSLDIYF